MAWCVCYALVVWYAIDRSLGDNFADLRVGGVDTSGDYAIAAPRLYQCVAAFCGDGPFGVRDGGSVFGGRAAIGGTGGEQVFAGGDAFDVAFYVRDNSVRRDKWISFTGGFGDESEADIEGAGLFVYWVRFFLCIFDSTIEDFYCGTGL